MNPTRTATTTRESDTRTPADPEFPSLPAEARLVALDTYRRLLAEGRDPDEAERVAADQAREWEAARAPGSDAS